MCFNFAGTIENYDKHPNNSKLREIKNYDYYQKLVLAGNPEEIRKKDGKK